MTEPAPHRVPRWVDAGVVAALMALVIVGTWGIGRDHDPGDGERAVDGLAYACGLAGTAALVFWRRWPVPVTAVVALTVFGYLARNYTGGPALLAGPLSLLALGYVAPRRTAWVGAAGLAAAAAIGGAIGRGFGLQGAIAAGWALAAVLAGQAIAGRRERAAAERERVAHASEHALATERLRIAQDLHDSVAHAMATINVQSGVAAHLIERRPEQAVTALEAIRVASRDALDELGAILGVLREPGADVPLAPVAGIDDIRILVERARVDGLAVTMTAVGDPSAPSPAIGAAAFRVVQEALTNVRRHAGPGTNAIVDVAVGRRGDLRVAVHDDGAGSQPTAPGGAGGFGLIGMRERVESSGGTVETGPTGEGGYRVVAAWQARPS